MISKEDKDIPYSRTNSNIETKEWKRGRRSNQLWGFSAIAHAQWWLDLTKERVFEFSSKYGKGWIF